MPRQCGYCTERTQANTNGRRKQHQAPVLVLRCHQNPKEMPTIVKEHALDHVSCPFWTRKRQMDKETANASPQDAQSDACRRPIDTKRRPNGHKVVSKVGQLAPGAFKNVQESMVLNSTVQDLAFSQHARPQDAQSDANRRPNDTKRRTKWALKSS